MDDEEFKKQVLSELAALSHNLVALDARVSERFDLVERRMDAIASRLDEQDAAYDRLNEKVDRLALAVRQSLEASEQALNAITPLSRRVWKLENPGGDTSTGRA